MTHEETIKRIQELVPESIGEDLYRCNRVWEAWQMNTMSEDDFEIIDNPITLAVVLRAIDTKYTEWKNPDTPVAINSKGEFQVWSENPVYKNVFWNLSKDDFNAQSEETKTFIGELLTT